MSPAPPAHDDAGPDGYRPDPTDPRLDAHRLLSQFLAEASARPDWWRLRPAGVTTGRAILDRAPPEQVGILHAALVRLAAAAGEPGLTACAWPLKGLISELLRRRLPLAGSDVTMLLARAGDLLPHQLLGVAGVVRAVERWVGQHGASPAVEQALRDLRHAFGRIAASADDAKLCRRLEVLLGHRRGVELLRGDPWGDAVLADLAAMADAERGAWTSLLAHVQSADGARPSKRWLEETRGLVGRVGEPRFRERALAWLSRVAVPKAGAAEGGTSERAIEATRQVLGALDEPVRAAWLELNERLQAHDPEHDPDWWERYEALMAALGGPDAFNRIRGRWWVAFGAPGAGLMPDRNAACLRGLVWACRVVAEDAGLARAVGDLGETCFRKVPGHGPFLETVGNACVDTLGAMSGLEPAAQLGRLKQRVKYPVAVRRVEQALGRAAARASVEPEDLEELAVPACGLTEAGRGRIAVGDHVAVISVRGTRDVELTWTEPEGTTRRSVPVEVRRSHPGPVKELARQVREIEKLLPVQRDRLERLLVTDRRWDLETWRARYLDHPLLATLARRLVWHVTDGPRAGPAIFEDGRLVDATGRPLDRPSDRATVRLWHPLGAAPEVVAAWRRWLLEHGSRQPFKQAHREIYVLTDAEQGTATESGRFAAHILRQHQFAALCRERGWRYRVQGDWDSHNVPTLPLPGWGLQAEFQVEPLSVTAADTARSGVHLHLSTGRVRFATPSGQPRALSEVPARVFSEVMRDVDLFVGVASIGTDPTWERRGDAPHQAYWQAYAFGDLGTSAAARRDLLAALVPRLRIGERCALEGRFLRVRGTLRSYRIHLGSANVLMEPNDQCLCLVPERGKAWREAGDVTLPFEGDSTLSSILSKAFLLADDHRIRDPTIVRQIRGGGS
jgi:hypothetical protein